MTAPAERATSSAADDMEALLLHRDTFQTFMMNPTGVARFLEYLCLDRSDGRLRFYLMTLRIRALLLQAKTLTRDLASVYLDVTNSASSSSPATHPLANVPKSARRQASADADALAGLVGGEELYGDAMQHLINLLFADSYPRFVKYQLLKYTKYKLSSDHEYMSTEPNKRLKGLGESFVLCGLADSDHKMLMVSDGFCRTTGYTRLELHKNCRLLQGRRTSAHAIDRMQLAIKKEIPHVDLLVNYRKDGTAFWNLLHIIPLTDKDEETIYFLGAQIDVSDVVNSRNKYQLLMSDYTSAGDKKPDDEPFERKLSFVERIFESVLSVAPITPPAPQVSQRTSLLASNVGASDISIPRQPALDSSTSESKDWLASVMRAKTIRAAHEEILHSANDLTDVADLAISTYAATIVFDPLDPALGKADNPRIRFITPKVCTLTGYNKAMLGRPFVSIFGEHAQVSTKAGKRFMRAVRSNTSASFEATCYKMSGEPFDVVLHLTPLKSTRDAASDRAVMWVAILIWTTDKQSGISPQAAQAAANFHHDRAIGILEREIRY
ncbi:hypothetical protein RI367_006051 [Sorochytrium milnesiophthora]